MLEAIHFSNNIPDCLIETTIKAFGKLKALRTFSIDGLQVTSSRAMTAWMPLHQLTRLDFLLQSGCEEEGLNVLRECTSATWIRVDSLGNPEPDHTILNLSTTPIHLPNLKILELAGMRCQVTELLFLHCPNLQVLSISSGPKSDLGEIISGYIAERKQNHTKQLRVLRVAELLPEQLEPFLSDEAVASIPVVEVKMVGVGAHSLDVARSALGLTERGSSKGREKIKVLEDHSDLIASAPITGWADPKVLVELDEYFSHEWTTPLNVELLHMDGRAQ
ncbi:hypothetical protein AN958_12469 [Leucoagaricus sp. SymC.cos]|nr:hypothetical protein AN958_12469 [Leucoagaricus sp. SymC.cos]